MRMIKLCVFVIAVSTFTMAVEDVYGWSKVKPHAEGAWSYVHELGTQWLGGEANARDAQPATGAAKTGSTATSD